MTDYVKERSELFVKLGKYYLCESCKYETEANRMPRTAAKNMLLCPLANVPGELLRLNEVIFATSEQ